MSRHDLVAMFHSYRIRNNDLLTVIFRILLHTLILLSSMTVSAKYFGDTYFANLSLFMLFSATVELMQSYRGSIAVSGRSGRYYSFLACVMGMLLSGAVLLQASCTLLQASCSNKLDTVMMSENFKP